MNNEKLLKKYHETYNQSFKQQLIENNIPLVKSIANKYASISNININELISYGLEGLIKSIDNFDFNFNNKFSTYAFCYFKGYIFIGIYEKQGLSRTKFSSEYLNQKKNYEQDGTYLKDNIEYIDEIIDNLVNKGIVSKYKKAEKRNLLLEKNYTSFDEIEDIYYYDNSEYDTIITQSAIQDLRNKFEQLFSYLTYYEKRIIELYFGFNDEPKKTEEIAKILRVSENRITRILNKGLKNLKKLAISSELNKYLEYFDDTYDENSKIISKAKRNQNN